MLKVLDLFSGIGGFSLGLERTGGFETVAFCEIDKHCQKVLKKHWPDTPIFKDVSLLTKRSDMLEYGEGPVKMGKLGTGNIDVICGGFPCQDISVAGKGKGLEGERSGLWFEYKRLIKEIKPRYVIIENVANLRSRGLTKVLQDLWSLGYDSEWHIISACSIGAIHRRERIWIIAYPNSEFLRKQSGWPSREKWKDKIQSRTDGETLTTTDPNHLRLWGSTTTEEEKPEWWAEASTSFSDVFRQIEKIEPTICRGDDGFPKGLDKGRRERIKQLGNSVVPQIVQLIGEGILEYEKRI